eukprot:3467131-Prymnesium_polylepis.1
MVMVIASEAVVKLVENRQNRGQGGASHAGKQKVRHVMDGAVTTVGGGRCRGSGGPARPAAHDAGAAADRAHAGCGASHRA